MAHTAPLAKAASPQAKSLSQKVVKLTKSGAAKSRLQANLGTARTKKAERSAKPSTAIVDIRPKAKAIKNEEAKKNAKTATVKAVPKRAAAKAVPVKARSKPPDASALTAVHGSANRKPAANPAIVKALDLRAGLGTPAPLSAAPLHGKTLLPLPAQQSRAASLSPHDIKVFQIYYLPEQQTQLDPDFAPYDNAGNASRLFEFSVFTKLAQSDEVKDAKLWGAMSWKFGKKAGISGRQFKEEVIAHPGYDAYYCNPYPENEALFHNMWLQGEIAHPNFMPLCAEIFEVAGLPSSMLTAMQPASEFSAANYFVANQAFWRSYIGFISRVLISADKKLSPTAKRIFYSSTADKFGAHAEASYIPFLVERLFTVFLRTEGAKFRSFKLSLNGREKKDNVHLKLLSEMKDIACRTKSMWLAACWINYRNLYLAKMYGEGWTKNHLKHITPGSIVFMPEVAASKS